MESVENGIQTIVGGEIILYKIFSNYKITNSGTVYTSEALLKINIYYNGTVIHQEVFQINSLKPNENVTEKLSFYYKNHKKGNKYLLDAQILVNFQVIYSLTTTVQ